MVAHAGFEELAAVAAAHNFSEVDAILLDLGVSSFQLDQAERGFSLMQPGPLDMRFDPEQFPSAADIVNEWPERELADLIYQFGEERHSRRIARYLIQNRPITTTQQLAEVVSRASGGRRGERIHPATRTFQALRIAVNRELEVLEQGLTQLTAVLKPGGVFALISFHSLEDRIVKDFFKSHSQESIDRPEWAAPRPNPDYLFTRVTRKPVVASEAEQRRNPRSRSAKLRVVQRRKN